MGPTQALLFEHLEKHGKYEQFLEFAAYMHMERRMSFFNAALVIAQRPGALCVLTEHAWERDYGRTVKPNALPIVMMQTNGPVSFVYDISDTVGTRAPKKYKNILEEHERVTPIGDLYEDLIKVIRRDKIYYSEKPMGLCMHGETELSDVPLRIELRGKEYKTHYSVTINSSDTNTSKAAAILHELAHIYCGHFTIFGRDDKRIKDDQKKRGIPNRKKEMYDDNTGHLAILDANTKEYEAEKTVELICRFLGLEYEANEYLDGYDMQNVDELLSRQFIYHAADKILDKLNDARITPFPVVDEENGFNRFCE